jgi:hypothetical protein
LVLENGSKIGTGIYVFEESDQGQCWLVLDFFSALVKVLPPRKKIGVGFDSNS